MISSILIMSSICNTNDDVSNVKIPTELTAPHNVLQIISSPNHYE